MKNTALDVWVGDGHQTCNSVQLLFEYKVERVLKSNSFLEKIWIHFCLVLNLGD